LSAKNKTRNVIVEIVKLQNDEIFRRFFFIFKHEIIYFKLNFYSFTTSKKKTNILDTYQIRNYTKSKKKNDQDYPKKHAVQMSPSKSIIT